MDLLFPGQQAAAAGGGAVLLRMAAMAASSVSGPPDMHRVVIGAEIQHRVAVHHGGIHQRDS